MSIDKVPFTVCKPTPVAAVSQKPIPSSTFLTRPSEKLGLTDLL